MKQIINIFTVIITVNLMSIQLVKAQSPGDLDTSFDNNGWIENNSVQESYHNNLAIDTQGKVVVAEIFKDLNLDTDYHVILKRYEKTGQRDMSLISGPFVLDVGLISDPVGVQLDENDGIFLAFSFQSCVAVNTMCQMDIFIVHYDKFGTLLGSQTVAFDYGSTYDRQDDVFADMKYNPSLKKLVVVAEVERDGIGDTDFGVAMLDVAPDGTIGLATSFSSDGITACYFDQYDSQGSWDNPKSVLFLNNPPYNLIVAGSAFEGNGDLNDGWNLAFCEYDVLGSEINKWSTLNMPVNGESKEILTNMALFEDTETSLIVTAEISNTAGMDFAVTKFQYNTITTLWDLNTEFGDGTTGWSVMGFSQLFIGDTEDTAQALFVQDDNKIVVAGSSEWLDNGSLYSQASLLRLNASGSLDTTWADSGKKAYNFTDTTSDKVNAMVEDSANKEIYIAGNHISNFRAGSFIANIDNNSDMIFKSGFE